MNFNLKIETKNQQIFLPILEEKKVSLFLKREDIIHPFVSGNKFRKLKYNLLKANEEKKTQLLTFGGAFSNHIAAVAYAGKKNNFETIGIIRGEALESQIYENPTLLFAQECGMKFHFVTREEYKDKTTALFIEKFRNIYGDFYLIPEGGTNNLAVKGCEEILTSESFHYKNIFCASGTGTTYKGISRSLLTNQKLTVINVLKFEAKAHEPQTTVLNNYHFGGYAKHTSELLEFKSWFEAIFAIPLDYVYTSKLFFAAFDLMKNNTLHKEHEILIIHCGGLQGNLGYEHRYKL